MAVRVARGQLIESLGGIWKRMDTQKVVILAMLSRSVDDLYDCTFSVIIEASELMDLRKVVILVAEGDLLAVMIQLRVPLTVVEKSEKGHRWVY